MTIWGHMRIAGAVVLLIGSFGHNATLFFLGLVIQYTGMLGAINLLERQVAAMLPKEKEDASDRD